jgi:hypothetical protein
MPNLFVTSAVKNNLMIALAYLIKFVKVLIEVFRESDFPFEYVLVNDHGVFIGKWVNTCVHFIYKDAQSPPVHPFAVALVQ